MRRDKYTGSVATPNAKVVGAVATEKLAVWEVGSGVRMNGGIVGGGMLTESIAGGNTPTKLIYCIILQRNM